MMTCKYWARPNFILLLVCCLGSLGVFSLAQDAATPAAATSNSIAPNKAQSEGTAKYRMREGAVLSDHTGFFRQDGELAVFVTSDSVELSALPNLSLERVMRTLKTSDEAESIRWSVSGVITEFNGRNYLLINRAVYKSASPPPAPGQILN